MGLSIFRLLFYDAAKCVFVLKVRVLIIHYVRRCCCCGKECFQAAVKVNGQRLRERLIAWVD